MRPLAFDFQPIGAAGWRQGSTVFDLHGKRRLALLLLQDDAVPDDSHGHRMGLTICRRDFYGDTTGRLGAGVQQHPRGIGDHVCTGSETQLLQDETVVGRAPQRQHASLLQGRGNACGSAFLGKKHRLHMDQTLARMPYRVKSGFANTPGDTVQDRIH